MVTMVNYVPTVLFVIATSLIYLVPAFLSRKAVNTSYILNLVKEIEEVKGRMSRISAEKTKKLKTLEARYKRLKKRVTRIYFSLFLTQWLTIVALLALNSIVIPMLGLSLFIKSPFTLLNGIITFTLRDGTEVILSVWLTVFTVMALQPLYLRISRLKVLYEAKI
ncbi:MAG: hypothetical protein DRO18_02310 [Thermoprotei archaeon]|nr:MAG: hypothetical protein DRO18_02310 [Thermoprotei archaeon]